MKLESLAFGIAGVTFGLIVGWVLGSQQVLRSPAAGRAAAEQSAPASATQTNQAPPIDENQARTLRETAEREPQNVGVRVQLGNLYHDGERCDQAIPWYEAAVKLEPKNANVSTDLGVCYYQTSQPDKALAQFEHSLTIDPKHVKTLFNTGIVRAFGKQDLEGATTAWKQVVQLAPGSQEAEMAQRGLEGIASAHPNLSGSAPPREPGK